MNYFKFTFRQVTYLMISSSAHFRITSYDVPYNYENIKITPFFVHAFHNLPHKQMQPTCMTLNMTGTSNKKG